MGSQSPRPFLLRTKFNLFTTFLTMAVAKEAWFQCSMKIPQFQEKHMATTRELMNLRTTLGTHMTSSHQSTYLNTLAESISLALLQI